ncbi:MAG: tyrosine-type recombinase/integrase [Saprospiraceae bacterium]
MQTEKKFLPTFHVYLPDDLSKEAYIHWTDNLGKRHHKKGGINRFRTAEERRAAALALIVQLKADFVPASPLADKMLAWIEDHRPGWRKKSYQTYRSKVDCFIAWAKGREVTKALVAEFFKHLLSSKHNTTYNTYLVIFKRIFKALDLADFVDGLESVSATSTPAKYFQKHQIERIQKHLADSDPKLWLACEFIYYCFIRPGELQRLKVGDIYFDEWKICVRSEISKNKKQQYVTIPVAFRPALEALKMRSPNEYIFFTRDCTKPVATNYFLAKFRKVLTVLGFGTEYQLYSWKHTGAVACVRAGASLKEVQIQLRHHSLEEVDRCIRQLGVHDLQDLENRFPLI